MSLNRKLYQILLVLSFLVVNALILAGLSAVVCYLNTGADRAAILHLPEEDAPAYLPKVTWAPLANEGRPIHPQMLSELERDYLKAWYIRNNASETNDSYGIADYYTKDARTKLQNLIALNKKNDTYIKSTTLGHHPILEFYSADGKIAVLTDTDVELYEEAYMNDRLVARRTEIATYLVMLLLEDGFWRIRHLIKLPSQEIEKTQQRDPMMEVVSRIKGINYYPQQNPWNMFGAAFLDSTIAEDFEKIKQMGLNTIRIFIPYETFGKAEVSSEKLEQLRTTLDIAANHELKVIFTLFDFYGDYRLRDWTLTHRHAEHIVTELKDHKALLAWDIKNEPDLDFETRGKARVVAWLQQMLLKVKFWDRKHPVTIGWSSPEAAMNLADAVDFISFHYYLEPAKFRGAYHKLRTSIPDKPILLQEYGYSSYDGVWNAYLGSAEDQADYFSQMQEVLESENLPYLFWTLHDFESVPNSVVGKLPWRKARQRHFGLLDIDGRPKEAFRSMVKEKR